MYIECKGVEVRSQNHRILHDIDCRMESGQIYGLWGKNGSGKTMLLRALCGLVKLQKGDIWLEGKRLGQELEVPASVGVLIEKPAFLEAYTGLENLKKIAALRGILKESEVRAAMERLELNPDDMRKYRQYSPGMQQRLGLACAMMEKPELILLDEPVRYLGMSGLKEVRKLLEKEKARGALVVVACQDREEMAFLADVVFRLEKGTITEWYTDLRAF